MNNKPQQETTLAREQRRKMKEWSDSIPDGAFSDDPEAQWYDKNGRTYHKGSSDLVGSGLDLGSYPPND